MTCCAMRPSGVPFLEVLEYFGAPFLGLGRPSGVPFLEVLEYSPLKKPLSQGLFQFQIL